MHTHARARTLTHAHTLAHFLHLLASICRLKCRCHWHTPASACRASSALRPWLCSSTRPDATAADCSADVPHMLQMESGGSSRGHSSCDGGVLKRGTAAVTQGCSKEAQRL